MDISVLRERWISLGKAQYLDDWFGMFIGIPIVGETEILQNELNPNMFRIMDPFTPFWNSHQYTPKDAPDPYFEIEVLKVGQVLWPGKEYETKITLSNLIMYDPICTGYYDNTNGGTHHYIIKDIKTETGKRTTMIYERLGTENDIDARKIECAI